MPQANRVQPQALTTAEQDQIVALLGQERFVDLSVQQAFWAALDEGCYIASQRSWYRVAAARQLSGDRRRQSAHPPATIPELVADGPNQVWSWDITRIRIRTQKTPLHLYLIEDVFSRKCVGWRLEQVEKDRLAAELVDHAVRAEGAAPHTLHADSGPSMVSAELKQTLDALGIARSHSRPHVSNDNPFSESLFKTIKYDLSYPGAFDTYDAAKDWLTAFVARDNHHHHHSGLAGFTPDDVHHGTWTRTAARRQALLTAAYQAHPDRYRHPPQVTTPPGTVWINKPDQEHATALSQPG